MGQGAIYPLPHHQSSILAALASRIIAPLTVLLLYQRAARSRSHRQGDTHSRFHWLILKLPLRLITNPHDHSLMHCLIVEDLFRLRNRPVTSGICEMSLASAAVKQCEPRANFRMTSKSEWSVTAVALSTEAREAVTQVHHRRSVHVALSTEAKGAAMLGVAIQVIMGCRRAKQQQYHRKDRADVLLPRGGAQRGTASPAGVPLKEQAAASVSWQ